MDEDDKIYISQGRTFFIGINHVRKEKILEWREGADIDWPSYLWYISQFINITDFGDDWFDVNITKKKSLTIFYRRSVLYNPELLKKVYERFDRKPITKVDQRCNNGFTEFSIRKKILSIRAVNS